MTPAIDRLRGRMLVLGSAALALCAAGALVSPDRFFHAYLIAWVFWLGVALGCLAILMLQHVTGGIWGLVLRRLLETGARTLPLMAVLFLPLLAGLERLYPWARPEVMAHSELLQHKAAYLNVWFFVARAGVYFAIWIALSRVLVRWSRSQDETGDAGLPRRMQVFSAGGLILYVLTMTFASVDWVMSLEPEWFSTIYPLLLIAGQTVAAFCFVIVVAVLLSGTEPLSRAITAGKLHDLGTLLFAFVMVWAYFAFSQFLIIWSGNLPEEIPWYLKRLAGGWEWVGLSLIVVHFALPFLLLLMRRVKRNARRLLAVAAILLMMRIVDQYWMMAPATGSATAAGIWLDLAAILGVGGLWLWMYLRQLVRMPLLPARDPHLQEALSEGHD